MHAAAQIAEPVAPDWARIETVCLDMDGTVLDLRFDNLFWLEALPRRWGALRGLAASEAFAQLKPRFDAKRGTLDWYCIDLWSDELGFDIAGLKAEMRDHIRYLPGAVAFLDGVRALGKRVLLTTNAHPISHDIKNRQTGISQHFDELVSSHEFGVPKESPEFWARLSRGHGVSVESRCSSMTAAPCWRRRGPELRGFGDSAGGNDDLWPHGDMNDAVFVLPTHVRVSDGTLTIVADAAGVQFSADIDLGGVCDGPADVCDLLGAYKETIRASVAATVPGQFNAEDTQREIREALRGQLCIQGVGAISALESDTTVLFLYPTDVVGCPAT